MLIILIFLLSAPLAAYIIWYLFGIFLSAIDRNRKNYKSTQATYAGKIAILYLSCNDFNPSALQTICKQSGIKFDLFLLDDSTTKEEKRIIDNWVTRQDKKIKLIRRKNRYGYKAGNINNWLKYYGNPAVYEYILIVDSDEHLPKNYTINLLNYTNGTKYSFVQGCHVGIANIRSIFQKIMHPQVECDWLHQLPARNIIGIPPMLGHGVLIKIKDLKLVGGFPNLISEDLALTIYFTKFGLKGIIAKDTIAFEEFPSNFLAYWIRRKRMIEADIQVVKNMIRKLLETQVGILAKIDLCARELRLAISSLYTIMLFIISFSGILHKNGTILVHSWFWLFSPLMFVTFLPVLSLKRLNLFHRLFYICSASFIGAAISSLSLIHTVKGYFQPPYFEVTGDRARQAKLLSITFFWEIFLSCFFIIGGIVSNNYSLVAIGFAIGCSPLMRTKLSNLCFILGVLCFWSLIFYQIYFDISNGYFFIEHIIVLIGISDANWG